MKAKYLLIPTLLFSVVACDSPNKNNPKVNSNYDADNTRENVEDRDFRTITPGDQSENEADRRTTQEIRRAVMADDSLSSNAKNVKIMTINGVVTLRGVVNNSQEKSNIEKKASSIRGVSRVDNQIEVTRS